jgi:hypothetical protein
MKGRYARHGNGDLARHRGASTIDCVMANDGLCCLGQVALDVASALVGPLLSDIQRRRNAVKAIPLRPHCASATPGIHFVISSLGLWSRQKPLRADSLTTVLSYRRFRLACQVSICETAYKYANAPKTAARFRD